MSDQANVEPLDSIVASLEAFDNRVAYVDQVPILDFNSIVETVAPVWRAEPEQNFVDWMDEHFKLTSESSGVASDWVTRPFQRAMSFAMADLAVPLFVECKPAQVGATKRCVAYYGYTLRERQRKVCIWQPTQTDIDDFSEVQLASMIRECPRVREALIGDIDTPSRGNSKGRRQFRGATAYARTAGSARNFRGISLDDAILDDYDGTPAVLIENKANVGTPRARAWNRTRSSPARKLMLISTPTKLHTSQVWKAYTSCAHRFLRYLPCLHCDHMQTLEFSFLPDAKAGLTWPGVGTPEEQADECYYQCEKCSGRMDYEDMREMDARGQWRSDDGLLYQRDSDGHFISTQTEQRVKRLSGVGYWYNALLSYEESWTETCQFYFDALNLYKTTRDDSDLVVFDNEYLAVASERRGGFAVDPHKLLEHLYRYDHECPIEVQLITVGVDVQEHYFDFEVVGWGANQQSWSLDTGTIPVNALDPNHPGWDSLNQLSQRRFDRDGEKVGINLMLIDGRFQPDNVKAFCAKAPFNRVCAQGQPNTEAQFVSMKKTPSVEGCYVCWIGTVHATKRVYSYLEIDDPDAPGYCHFPDRQPYFEVNEITGEVTSDFFSQLTSEQIVQNPKTKKLATEATKGRRNEKHDDRKLNCAALECLLRRSHRLMDNEKWVEHLQGVSGAGGAYASGYQLGA